MTAAGSEADAAGGGVRALERGLDILSCFDVAHPSWTLSELAQAAGLHKATTRRLVKTLEAKGFLALDERPAATGSARCCCRSPTWPGRTTSSRAWSRPFLEDLAAATQGSVGLWVWAGASVVLIDRE